MACFATDGIPSPAEFRHFLTDDDGGTTADWIVLTAGVVGLSIGGMSVLKSGEDSLADDLNASLAQASVVSLGTLAAQALSVVGSGRGYQEVFEGTCTKEGCSPGYTQTNMYYQLSDGSWANMVSIEYEDGRTETTWTDRSGNPINPAPVFN